MEKRINKFLEDLDEIVARVFDEDIDLEEFTKIYTAAKMNFRGITNKVTSMEVINRAENSITPGLVMRIPENSFTHLEIKLDDEGKKLKIILI